MENTPINKRCEAPPPYSVAIAPPAIYSSQPPPGYYPSPGVPQMHSSVPSYGTTTTVIVPEIIVIGACPACRDGVLQDDYTCLGIFCAIFFFPLGILCCLLMKNRRCSNCGAYFG